MVDAITHRPAARVWHRTAQRAVSAALMAVFPFAASAATTYKCIIDGRTVFQQTGCPANSQLDTPKAASVPAVNASAPGRGRVGAASAPASAGVPITTMTSSASAPRAAAASSVRVNIPRK